MQPKLYLIVVLVCSNGINVWARVKQPNHCSLKQRCRAHKNVMSRAQKKCYYLFSFLTLLCDRVRLNMISLGDFVFSISLDFNFFFPYENFKLYSVMLRPTFAHNFFLRLYLHAVSNLAQEPKNLEAHIALLFYTSPVFYSTSKAMYEACAFTSCKWPQPQHCLKTNRQFRIF